MAMARVSMNRLNVVRNRYQGAYKKVLCVCSAGILRSPTAAVVLSQEPYNFNTRAAGVNAVFALIPIDEALLLWADEIVCMSREQEAEIKELHSTAKVINLNIPDEFEYRDPDLMRMIQERYDAATAGTKYPAEEAA